ncbi:MAG: DNA polymerase IV [Tenericutes bacterium HGW-Tenericutes-6]|nr:MAG: DNA polymerase IV [Tenericutes bacterium HGW-Tenericutes-6]
MKESVLMKNDVKIIFHIDLNAFFASCAVIKEPYLKDKVFVVGGNTTLRRGVISTASYAARKLGIHSAMNINDALYIYPKLVVVPLEFQLYHKYSQIFFKFLKKYADLVLEGSIDEAYVDMTERSKHQHPLDIAKEIQQGLLQEHGLPCSIGIAPTLFLAKMASDMKKPLGITVLRRKDIVEKLFPLPIKECYGIGKKTYPKLEAIGVTTIGDFTKEQYKHAILEIMSEASYLSYLDHILGRSSDIIDPKKYMIPKSISNETTLNYPMDQREAIFKIVIDMLEEAHERLTRESLVSKTVGIKLKNTSFETMNRGKTLDFHTDDYDVFYDTIEQLFEAHYDESPVRLVGVFLSSVMQKKDLKIDFNLFNYQELSKREESLYQTIKDINDTYPGKIQKGTKKTS